MTEPRTKAGSKLLNDWRHDPKELWTVEQVANAILAIEDEAATPDPAGLRAALTKLRDTSPDPNTRSAANYILAGLEPDHD